MNHFTIGPADDRIERECASELLIWNDFEEEIYESLIIKFWKMFFDPKWTLILTSCSWGREAGIAMRISRMLPEITVIASKSVGHLESISYNDWNIRASFTWDYIGTEESKFWEWKESVVYYQNGEIMRKN